MTSTEANALHNPFISNGRFCRKLQIDCTALEPDASLLRGAAVALTFPSQEWINVVSSGCSISALFLDRPRAKDLSPVANLPLTNLSMSYPSHVKDWTFLRRLPKLVRLSLHNTLSLTDLEAVGNLTCLEVFQLSGGYSKPLRLPSLAPLTACHRLVAILLAAVRCADWSLEPLAGLASLRRLDCPNWWPIEQVQALLARNKALHSNVTEPA